MKAKNLNNLIVRAAPAAWKELPEIKKARPGVVQVLLQLTDTNICAWYNRRGLVWERQSDLFIVEEEAASE